MSSVDPKAKTLLAKTSNHQDVDEDDVLAELEAEDDSAFRAQRVQQLSEEIAKSRPTQVVTVTADLYKTLKSDDEVLRFTTVVQKTVVHFSHSDFARCSVMDVHLRKLADAHARSDESEVRFAKADVKDCGFVVEKLGVRVLPCVIGFLDGQGVGRVVGFEGVIWPGAREDSLDVTKALEGKLVEWKLMDRRVAVNGLEQEESDEEQDVGEKKRSGGKGIRGRKEQVQDDDEEWD